jgi:SAM-dependent methyltransferase
MNTTELDKMYAVSYLGENSNKTPFPMEGFGKVKVETYGEFTRKGVETYMSYFKKYLNKDGVFYDLGSGLGKMVIHIGEATDVKKSCGIEYSKERSNVALDIKKNYADDNNRIKLIEGDILKHDLSDATIVYFDNTCYSNESCTQIFDALPNGCLITYKRYFKNIDMSSQTKIAGVEFNRTYFQNTLLTYIKGDK